MVCNILQAIIIIRCCTHVAAETRTVFRAVDDRMLRRKSRGLAGNDDGRKKVIKKKKKSVTFRIGPQPVDGRAIHITRLVQTAMFFNEIASDLATNSSGKVHGRRAIKVTSACKSPVGRPPPPYYVIIILLDGTRL